MATTINDLDYYSIQLNERLTISPKERRILEHVKENPRSLSGDLKDLLRKEGWERYEEEMEGKVHTWPHLELANKGLIYSHNQGTARYWVLTQPGTQLMKDLEDGIETKLSNDYTVAQKQLESFASPTEMLEAISIMASIILKGKSEDEIQTKFEKLFEYGLPGPIFEMLQTAKRTNEGGVIRVTI